MAEKDILEKRLLDYAEIFADVVNALLFHGRQFVDPAELLDALPRSVYKAAGRLREQERDVAKYWGNGEIRIALLGSENQTGADPDMPIRVIGYDGASYRDELNADEKGKPKVRYPVVTMVLYFGTEKRWDQPVRLKECFAVREELEPYVNDYRLNLFEIAWLSKEEVGLFRSDFRFVADYFRQMRETGQYDSSEGRITRVWEVLELLTAMSGDPSFKESYVEEMEGGTTMAVIMDRRTRLSLEKGLEQGRAEGKVIGAIQALLDIGLTENAVREKVMRKFQLDNAKADAYMAQAVTAI